MGFFYSSMQYLGSSIDLGQLNSRLQQESIDGPIRQWAKKLWNKIILNSLRDYFDQLVSVNTFPACFWQSYAVLFLTS